jgi:hypothetical protein
LKFRNWRRAEIHLFYYAARNRTLANNNGQHFSADHVIIK